MSEAVKRYVIRHGCVEEASSLLPGERAFVLASDHDRIVSSLTEAGRKLQAERDQLRHLLIEAVVELKELKESVGYRAHTIGVIQRIDAALEAS